MSQRTSRTGLGDGVAGILKQGFRCNAIMKSVGIPGEGLIYFWTATFWPDAKFLGSLLRASCRIPYGLFCFVNIIWYLPFDVYSF